MTDQANGASLQDWADERQRLIDELDRFKAWGEAQFARARASDHAVYMLKTEHLGASVDLLRSVAERIDCEPGCEHVSPFDWSTGIAECPLSDRGECLSDDACALRDLADALATHAQATEARRAATPAGSVHESAVPQACAQPLAIAIESGSYKEGGA